jgi:hypothetical protein
MNNHSILDQSADLRIVQSAKASFRLSFSNGSSRTSALLEAGNIVPLILADFIQHFKFANMKLNSRELNRAHEWHSRYV